ncbi:MAG: hypothetical protein H8M99_03835 [Gloeobacteraceae cyanobacterium ES-bin-144]|nr:hypothetical protein [Verrucomicrobiales bacterium]
MKTAPWFLCAFDLDIDDERGFTALGTDHLHAFVWNVLAQPSETVVDDLLWDWASSGFFLFGSRSLVGDADLQCVGGGFAFASCGAVQEKREDEQRRCWKWL